MAYLDFEKPIIELQEKIKELKSLGSETLKDQIEELEGKVQQLTADIFKNLTPIQKTRLARHPDRPYTLDYAERIFEFYEELHGDRLYSDDRAIVGGLAKFKGISVVFVGHQKGRSVDENMERNFGMAHPEGYRKALRLFKLAEKLSLPIITFIDTPGAYPGIGAEERGQAEAIARNLMEMAFLKVPVVAVVIGEGGSGGALGIGVANRVLMMEYSIYSVISPEGCASILWRDSGQAPKAAEALKLTAQDLLSLGVIDEIIPEPLGGAHRDFDGAARNLSDYVLKHLRELMKLSPEQLVEQRYKKFRSMGVVVEGL